MKKFFTKLNITQKIFLFLCFLNQPLYYFYGELWLGETKTRVGSGRGNTIEGEVYENYNYVNDDEVFLWIGVSIVLLIGFFLFKSNQENE